MDPARIVLVTGANSGIGRAAALQLAERGAHVVLGCRDPERGAAALEEVRRRSATTRATLLPIDLASRASIERAAAEVCRRYGRLDAVVHNAATFDPAQGAPERTEDGVERVWATNHLGPARLTDALLPALEAAAHPRVVFVTSRGLTMFPRLRVDLEDPEFRRRRFTITRAYYQSKLAQLCYFVGMGSALAERGVTAHGVRVTNVAIDTGRYPGMSRLARAAYAVKRRFAIPPERMAACYVWLALDSALDGAPAGYWDAPGVPAPLSRAARDPEHVAAVVSLTRRALAGGAVVA